MPKHFLHLSDYTSDELWELLKLAKELKTKFKNKETYKPFDGKSLAMIFAKPSARTRVSFETGFEWMGGHALFLGPNDIGIGKREAIKDISRVFSRYNDMIMARLFDHKHIVELAKYSNIPVINGLTDYNHPCQILADIMTVWEHRGNRATNEAPPPPPRLGTRRHQGNERRGPPSAAKVVLQSFARS